jgi:hypothetical protein
MGAISRLLLRNRKIVQTFVVAVEGVEKGDVVQRALGNHGLRRRPLWKSGVENCRSAATYFKQREARG